MFATRTNIVKQKIQLVRLFSDSANNEILNSLDESLHQDFSKVYDFLRKDISSFARAIIEGMIEYNLIDYEFLNEIFLFDHELYTQIFLDAPDKFNKDYKWIEDIALRFTNIHQTVLAFQWAYKPIDDGVRSTNLHYELQDKLVKIHSSKSYTSLHDKLKQKVSWMLDNLPAHIDCLRSSPSVIISNSGNGLYLTSKRLPKGRGNALAFDSRGVVLKLHYQAAGTESYYKLQANDDFLMCKTPPNSTDWHAIFGRTDDITKWTINLCDPENPSKGYLIKATNHNAYLRSNPVENFEPYVLLKQNIDEDEYIYFTWKIQLCTGN